MTERLSASDMSSLLAERGPIHVHVGGTAIFDGKPPKQEEFLAHVGKRLNLIPRFRQRIVDVPTGIANPVWADDSGFDLGWHVRRVALPKPGDEATLRELVGWIMSEPLDFKRPLWQLYLIEGLGGKRFAALSKTHHALVDGVSAVDVGAAILDPDPKGTEISTPEGAWDPQEPRADRLLMDALRWRASSPARAAGSAATQAVRNALSPIETPRRIVSTARAFYDLTAGAPNVPKLAINQEIGRDRRIAFAETTLERLNDARRHGDATVNDVILSVCTGALRRFLVQRGDEVPSEIVALVPMSVRKPGDEHELGNRIATLMVRLPLGETDPARRLAKIHRETTRVKNSEQATAASLVIEAAGFTPPTVNRILAGAMSRPLGWNLVISNVPGPQMPIYLLGRRLNAIHPYVPLSPQGHGLTIGVLSYDGRIFFGLVGDRDLLPDLDRLAVLLEYSLEDQLAAAYEAG